MSKTGLIITFFLSCTEILWEASIAQEWTAYSIADGLIANSVRFIHEDHKKGYLWFTTTFDGASQYDGSRFKNLTITDGLLSGDIYFTLIDKKGNVWFATDLGVSMYNGESIRNFDVTNGLPDKNVNYILEDRKGNFWFGTNVGISRYDGKGFEVFDIRHGLSDNYITRILQDSLGIIWLGTGKGVSRYDGKEFQPLSTSILADPITVLFKDRNSNIWFGTETGIFRKNISSMKIEKLHQEAHVISILEDQWGNLWFGTDNLGVIKFNYKENDFDTHGELSDRSILSMMKDSKGNIWFGTDRGISRYNGKSIKHFYDVNGTSLNFVECMLEDSDENLWFGAINGIFKYTVDNVHHFTTTNGLADDCVKDVTIDNEGNVWFGTENGVSKYDGDEFLNYTTRNGLLDNHILSTFRDSKGTLWFGTVSGICNYSEFFLCNILEYSTAVRSICEDTKGNLWFVTPEGINKYDGSVVQPFLIEGITETLLDNRDNLWIGSETNGLYKIENGESLISYTTRDGLACNHVKWILQTHKDGHVWFGLQGGISQTDNEDVTLGGICRYNGKSFRSFSIENGLLSENITVALEDGDGNLWLGTDKGVMKYENPPNDTTFNFSAITTANGLISDYITAIQNDKSGNLWFGTDKGVSKYDGENFQNISLEKYFDLGFIEKIFKDGNGTIWFITTHNGVIRYNPPTKEIHPRIYLTQIEADKIYRNVDDIKVPTTSKLITFEYKGISFITEPKRIRYKYILEGYDSDWHPSTLNERVSYKNPGSGDYQFKVYAIDKDLHYSDPMATVAIHIFQPFYGSLIFTVLITIFGICLVGGGGYLLIQLKKQRQIATKFKEKLRKQAEAERIQIAKMESLRQLVAGVAHEMNNPIGVISSSSDASNRAIKKITTILSDECPGKIKEDKPLKKTLDVLKNTIHNSRIAAERAAKTVANLRSFVRLDEGEWQNADIHEAMDSVIALMEPEMEDKIIVRKEYGDPVEIFCCPSSLNQVFMTVLKNASEAIKDKGEIKVRTFIHEDKVIIEISDNGIGIPPDNLTKIFDPGFTTKGVKVGVGLGLAICHKIIFDEHRGRIDVSSELGMGTKFKITLPLVNTHKNRR